MKKLTGFLTLFAIAFLAQAQQYNQTSALVNYTLPAGGAFGNVTLTNAPNQPASPGTLTFYYVGDLDGGVSGNEFMEVIDENNNVVGPSGNTNQCAAGLDSTTFTIPIGTLAQWAADGNIDFSFNASSGVANFCTQNAVRVKLQYIYVTGPNFCPLPSNLSAQNVDTNSLDLSWTTGGSNVWNLQYGKSGFSIGNGTIINNVTSNPYSFSGLQSGETYDFYVQDSCLSTNNASFWVGPLRVTIPIAAPYYQGFDSVVTPDLPFGWQENFFNVSTFSIPSARTTNGSGFNDPIPYSPPNCGMFDIIFGSSTFSNDTVYMITPPVYDLSSGENRVRFKAFNRELQQLEVGIMSNPSVRGSFTPIDTIENIPSLWQEYAVNVTNYTGPIAHLAFRYTGRSSSSDMYIDDVYWEQIPNNDIAVTGFDNPSNPITLGNQPVEVEITNFGIDSLVNATVNWEINGVAQTPANLTFSGANILFVDESAGNQSLGTFNFTNQINIVKAWTSSPNGVQDEVPDNDTARTIFCSPFSGTYTLGGSSADFPDFELLSVALEECGLSGPTIIKVNKGTYNDQLVLSGIPGLSSTNTLTIIGDSASNTLITASGSALNSATVLIDSADYITLKKLTIQNESVSIGRGVMISNGSDHITIDSCIFNATNPQATANLQVVGVFMGPSMTSNFTGGSNGDHITIQNSEFYNCEAGIRAEYLGQLPGTDLKVINNFFEFIIDDAILVDVMDSIEIRQNKVQNMAVNFGRGFSFTNLRTFIVEQNELYVGGSGISFSFANDTTGTVGLIANNIISSDNRGLSISDCNNAQLYHNSIKGSPSLFLDESQGLDFRNNILVSDNALVFDATNSSFVDMNYNIYTTGGPILAENNGATFVDLADFFSNLPLYNGNSLSGNPNFVGPDNFRILFGTLANDAGDNSVPISIDIDGESRPASGATSVDIGADEYTPPQTDIGINRLNSPSGFCFTAGDSMKFEIINYGLQDLNFATDSFEIHWEVTGQIPQSGSEFITVDTLASGDTTVITLNATVDMSEYGSYTFDAYVTAGFDSLPINDTLNSRTIIAPTILAAYGDTTFTAPGGIATLTSTSAIIGDVVISEVVQFAGGQGATNPYPSYMPSGDFDVVELANLGTYTNLSNYTFEIWRFGAIQTNYTIPAGTELTGNSVALLVFNSGVDDPSNNLFFMNSTTTSSGVANGYILKDPQGNIVDVVATDGFIFPTFSGVTGVDWSGTVGSSSGRAGIIRTGIDSNNATNWTVASLTNVMSIGAFNPGLTPSTAGVVNWTTDTGLVDTTATILVGPYTANGTYQFFLSDTTPCGFLSDTVTITVDIPYPDTGFVDVVIDSVTISDSLLCNANQTNVSIFTTNTGTDTVFFVPASYALNGGTPVFEQFIDTLYPNQQVQLNFSLPAVFTGTGTQTIQAWVTMPGDTLPTNDTNLVMFENNPLPAKPTASQDSSYCPGAVIQPLSVSGAGGTYTWYDGLPLDTSSVLGVGNSIQPNNTSGLSRYWVTETDSIGCTSIPDTVEIGIFGFPNASAGGNTSLCIGSSKLINASGGVDFVWNTGDTTATINISPTVNTNYSVTVTDANGCVAADTILVSIDSLPMVTLTDQDTVCLNAPAFAPVGGMPAGGTYTGDHIVIGVFNPVQAGVGLDTIVYTFTDNNGCSNSDTGKIYVRALPVVTFPNLPAVCANEPPFAITGGTPSGGTYSGSGVVNGTNFNAAQAGFPGNKFITYSYTDNNGCTNSKTASIEVLPIPSVSLNPFAGICEDYSPFPLAGGTPSGGTYSGSGVVNDSLFPAQSSTGNVPITYTFTGSNGCSNSATQPILINAIPQTPRIFQTAPDTLTADVSAPLYSWFYEGAGYPGNTQSIQALLSGNYRVVAVNGACNSAQSDRFFFEVVGLEEVQNEAGVSLFPNPNNGNITLKGVEKAQWIRLYNSNGELVEQVQPSGQATLHMNIQDMATGIYFIEIETEKGLDRLKVIKR